MSEYTTLCYVNASDRLLKNAEFNFDSEYEFHIDIEKNTRQYIYTLSVVKRENPIPSNFWGENISSLNVIAGRNGVGKTSFLKFVINTIGTGITAMNGEGAFYVLRYGKKFLYAHNYRKERVRLASSAEQLGMIELNTYVFSKKNEGEKNRYGNDHFWKNYIFYSNFFGANYGTNDQFIVDISLDHRVNEIMMQRDDLPRNSKEYILQDTLKKKRIERIFDFTSNQHLQTIAEKIGMTLPELLVFNLQTRELKEELETLRILGDAFWMETWVNKKRCEIYASGGLIVEESKLHFESAINLFAVILIIQSKNEQIISQKKLEAFVIQLSKTSTKTGIDIAIELFKKRVRELENSGQLMFCKECIDVLNLIQRKSGHFILAWQNDYQFVIQWQESERELVGKLLKQEKKFYKCSLESAEGKGLFSAGEQSRIDLLISMYEGYLQVLQNDNPSNSILLVADEIDTYFHPQYQLSVVSDLVGIINEIFKGYKVQILLTTNTPLEMTDIPNDNITYLEAGQTVKHRIEEKTFAGNYITLLKNSFFTDSTMGDFSKKKINQVIHFLQHQKAYEKEKICTIDDEKMDQEHVKYILSIIGEPIIKNKLKQWYNELFPEE